MENCAPLTPMEENITINLSDSKEFILSNDEKKYKVQVGKSESLGKLGFIIRESPLESKNYYYNFYDFEELKGLSKSFRCFDNIMEAIISIQEIFEDKKPILKFENDSIVLIVKINKIGKGEDFVNFRLNKKSLSLKEICENLSKEVNNLKKELKELKEEKNNDINELKEEIKMLKKEIQELKNNKMNENDLIRRNNAIDSKIIEKKEELDFITNRLKQIDKFQNKDISYNLIYRGTRDGHLPKDFHQKCDGKSNTITLIKTIKGMKFGGYITNPWDNHSGWISNDEKCFIFQLNFMKIYTPKIYKNKYQFANNCGPNFSEFGLSQNLFEYSSLNIQTKNTANLYFNEFTRDYEINGGEQGFKAEEIEVFQIII